ncbi:hypothetical protein LUZ60_008774 [Juncus effusus]|nr:hypothetical protein LUZ60_008774 [Juncus effusus]
MNQQNRNVEIKIKSRALIKASNPSSLPKSLISNLDLLLGNFQISFISIYPSSSPCSFDALISVFQSNLPSFLNHFYPFTGRVITDSASNLPSLVCNNSGAELVIAETKNPLSSLNFSEVDQSLNLIQLQFAPDLALSIQLVKFSCGGFSISWSTNHLLVDGHGLSSLVTTWTDFINKGAFFEYPNHDRSIFVPRSPKRYNPSLDQEFTLHESNRIINVLSGRSLLRKLYRVEKEDVDKIRSRANGSVRVTRLEALSAYLWKLLAASIGDLDTNCRMAWIADGRRRLGPKYEEAMKGYLGNVVTYTSREARVEDIKNQPLDYGASLAREAIEEVSSQERFEQLVDWMEDHKNHGKWTETIGVGLGSPTIVISFLAFRVELNFGFGDPVMAMTWIRPSRLGSGSFVFIRGPKKDGSWFVSARLWPRLADVIERDPEMVFKPVTAESLGLVARSNSRL